MRFRKLRIAWSVLWGLAAVLLIVVWVRSYSWVDRLEWHKNDGRVYGIELMRGKICVYLGFSPFDYPDSLHWNADSIDDWLNNGNQTLEEFANEIGTVLGFGFHYVAEDASLIMPIWFAVLLSAALAAAASIKWRYTLRTLLIATTLVAVVLGLIVWSAS